MKDCDPSVIGIMLRLTAAFLLIAYGVQKENYFIVLVGLVPLVRLAYYFLYYNGV